MISYNDIRFFLAGHVPYYQKLPPNEQTRFVHRVHEFIRIKSIEGRQGLQVSSDMKILLASSAVQLTFGLETWNLSYFNYIMLFPADYQNPNTKNYHKGETNMGGFMCFSWKHFLEGLAVPNDKINLGLHEFAHALRFNGVRGDETDYFFTHYFDRWLACAVVEFQRLRHNHASIFRKYGAVNLNEFFSVAVETFFETPKEFKAYFPELFEQTAILLNQYIDDNGQIKLHVRQDLMDSKKIVLQRNYDGIISYTLRGSGLVIFALLFLVIGAFSLSGEGYKYPPAYICLGIAAVCWMVFEKGFTRVWFDLQAFEVQKGFLIFRNYSRKRFPYSHLVSLLGHGDGDVPPVYALTLTHVSDDGYFYEESMRAHLNEHSFDQLASELRRNHIHVYLS